MARRAWRPPLLALFLFAAAATPWPGRERLALSLAGLAGGGEPTAEAGSPPEPWPPAARWLRRAGLRLGGALPVLGAGWRELTVGAGTAEGLRRGDFLAVPTRAGPALVGEVIAAGPHTARARTLFHPRSWWVGELAGGSRLVLVGEGSALAVRLPEVPEALLPGAPVRAAADPERPLGRGLLLARLQGPGEVEPAVDPLRIPAVGVWRGRWVPLHPRPRPRPWRPARILLARDADPLRDAFLCAGPGQPEAAVARGHRFLGWVRRAGGGRFWVRGPGDPGFWARVWVFRGGRCVGAGVYRGGGFLAGAEARPGDRLVVALQGRPEAGGLLLGEVDAVRAGQVRLAPGLGRRRGQRVWVGAPPEG